MLHHIACLDIPTQDACRSPSVAIVVTSRGGHIAFLDGCLVPNEISFMHRLFSQFAEAILNNGCDFMSRDDDDDEN